MSKRWPNILRPTQEPVQPGSTPFDWEEAEPTVENIPEGVQRKYDAIRRLIREQITAEAQVDREARKLERIKADINRFRSSLAEDLIEIGMVCRNGAENDGMHEVRRQGVLLEQEPYKHQGDRNMPNLQGLRPSGSRDSEL